MLSIIVLAAGMSRRMGQQNKLRLPFGKSTILQTTLHNIIEAGLGEVLVIVGFEKNEIKKDLMPFKNDLKIIVNPNFESGMTSSIQAGVMVSSQNTEGYMICLSDMPLIQSVDYQQIKHLFLDKLKTNQRSIVQPTFEGQRGNPTLLSNYYKNHILNLADTEGCKPIVKNHAQNLYFIEMPNDAVLRDADTPEAYQSLCLHLN